MYLMKDFCNLNFTRKKRYDINNNQKRVKSEETNGEVSIKKINQIFMEDSRMSNYPAQSS